MTILDAINDAIKRGWRLVFAEGERGEFVITGRKIHDDKLFMVQRVLAPGAAGDDDYVVVFILDSTDDRYLPPTQAEDLAAAIIERSRRDPDAPWVICGPLEMLDREYLI